LERTTLTPEDYHENPELAVLEILESALEMTELCLIANYPDVHETEADHQSCGYSERLAYVACLTSQVQALNLAITKYRTCLELQRQRYLSREQSQKKDINF